MKETCNCENCDCECCQNCRNKKYVLKRGRGSNAAGGGAVYGLGIIGAAIYFISQAPDFWMGVVGFLKALVWPAFMIYEAFKFLIG